MMVILSMDKIYARPLQVCSNTYMYRSNTSVYLVLYSVTCVAGSLRHNHYHNYCNNKIIVVTHHPALGVMAMVLNDIKDNIEWTLVFIHYFFTFHVPLSSIQ